ncbi:MAG: sialidase family protein [Anaerolineales bacterium]
MKKHFMIFIFLIVTLPLKTLDTWMLTDIRLDTGDPVGTNTSERPKITCYGSNVYAAWMDFRNGNMDIYFNSSTDNGVTWQSSDIRLDTGDTAGANSSEYPQLTCSDNNVYVVWFDYRNGAGDIYFNYSNDNGINWKSSDIRLDTGDTAGANYSYYPQIICTGNNVYVVWYDGRNFGYDIYFNYSIDGGVNWQLSDIRLDTGDTAGANSSREPQITCLENKVFVVWSDKRNGDDDIYFNYSTDNGVTWQPSDIRLDTGDSAGANDSFCPQIACFGNNVYAVWLDYRDYGADIYFNCSNDNGITWQSSDIRLDAGDAPGSGNSYYPQITCSGNNVYVVWHDNRNGFPDIYFNYSTDNGQDWQSSAIRLDTGDIAGANYSYSPQITCSVNNVYVVWYDYRNGSTDIYINNSTNGGATWQSSGIRLDTGDIAGANNSEHPQITSFGSDVYVIWHDVRNGSADIYFNKLIPPWIDIKANGSDEPVSITQSDTLQIKVSLNRFGLIVDVDYWLAYKGPFGWIHYSNTTKKWEPGLGVTHQGPLLDLNNKKVFQKSGLAPGKYIFFFGVDMNMDGNLTKSEIYYDQVKVTVTQ